jgi:hypothetical protein
MAGTSTAGTLGPRALVNAVYPSGQVLHLVIMSRYLI